MCGKVISGADYEQINSFGGGDFSNGQQIFHHEPNRRNTKKAAALMPRPKPFRRPDGFRTTPRTVFERLPERFSNEPPDSPPTERFSNHPLGQIPDCRPNLFRAPSRRCFRLPFGRIPPHRPDKSRTASRRNFRPSSRTDFRSPDGFRTAIRTNHNSDASPPRKSHRKAGGIPGGATYGRNRLTRTSGSAAPPTCIRLSAPAPRRTRARK